MMRFVVQDGQLLDVANDHAEVNLAVSGSPARPRPEEIVHRVLVFGRRERLIAGVDAMNVCQENIARLTDDAHLVLHVQGQLKIVAPIPAVKSVFRQHRIPEEYVEPLEVLINAIQYDDVGSDDEKVAC